MQDIDFDDCFTSSLGAPPALSSTYENQRPAESAVPVQVRKFDRTLRGVAFAAQRGLQKKFSDSLQRELTNGGGQYKGLAIRVRVTAMPAATRGSSVVLKALLSRILSVSVSSLTQTAIRDAVKEEFRGQAVYKDWTKPLPDWAIKFAQNWAIGTGPTFSGLKIRKSMTLSQLYKEARVSLMRKQADQCFRPVVAVSSEGIAINGQQFKFTTNKVKDKSYEIVRLSVPKLLDALQTPMR